jgi:cytochrome c oxidase subunit 4
MSTVEHPTEPLEAEHAGEHVEHATAAHHDATHDSQHPPDRLYVGIAAILFVLTAMEVSTYYLDYGVIFLPLLLTLMSIKFVLVVLFFMHLKFDAKIFGRLFWAGFFLAVAVYTVALATFKFFINT